MHRSFFVGMALILALTFLPGCATTNSQVVCGSSPYDLSCTPILIAVGAVALAAGGYFLIKSIRAPSTLVRGTCYLQDSIPPSHPFPQACPAQNLKVLDAKGKPRGTVTIDQDGQFIYDNKSGAPFRLISTDPNTHVIEQDLIDGGGKEKFLIHLKKLRP